MEPVGEGRKGIFIIGESPSSQEDALGESFVGKAGEFLRETLEDYGIHLERDCWKTNAIQCHPRENRTPSDFEIQCCRTRLHRQIQERNPSKILLLGNSAIQSIIGHRWTRIKRYSVSYWRGFTIPDAFYKAWICATYHPSAILRALDDKIPSVIPTLFFNDMDTYMNLPERTHFSDLDEDRKNVRVLYKRAEIERALIDVLDNPDPLFAFDYETTGLKPQDSRHRIVYGGFSVEDGKSTAFPFPITRDDRIFYLWRRILLDPRIEKTAHHIKFEENWSRAKVGLEGVVNWKWCSMEGAHILDNREGITGLKFQTYIRFGIPDYSSAVDKFLTHDDEDDSGSNAMNNITNADPREAMIYCGLDCIYQRRLALDQMIENRLLATSMLEKK